MIKNKILSTIFGIFMMAPSFLSIYAFKPFTNEADNQAIIKILKNEPSLLKINGPTVVVGDIHGNLESLVRCVSFFKFEYNHDPRTKILFLGDYVDRGRNSVECLETILELKLRYPYNVFLLRGNHEDISVSSSWFGKLTCLPDSPVFIKITSNISKIFSSLSLAAIVNDGISNTFCVHGGITEKLCNYSLSKIDSVKKGSYPTANLTGNLNSKNRFIYNLLWDRFEVDFFEKDIRKFFEHHKNIKRIVKGHDLQTRGYTYRNICHTRDFCIIHSTECFRGNLSGIGYIHDGKIDLGNFMSSNPVNINWNKQ